MATINASDGIVCVEEGACGHGVRACFANVTVAGAHPVLSVNVDTRKADGDLLGLTGHELRHTVESSVEQSNGEQQRRHLPVL
jgi:hypothetical protein